MVNTDKQPDGDSPTWLSARGEDTYTAMGAQKQGISLDSGNQGRIPGRCDNNA